MTHEARRTLAVGLAVSLWEMRGKDLNGGAPPAKTVRVPAGWSVVGGTVATGTMNSPAMVICR